jgi:hypothetical protein
MVSEVAKEMCKAVLALPAEDWTKDRVLAVLAEKVEAGSMKETPLLDPLSALRFQKAVLEKMATSTEPMRYGEMLRCQEIAQRLHKANKAATKQWAKLPQKFNKVKKAAKLKVGASAGLPKLNLGWLDDDKNVHHMSERDMEAFPGRFDAMLVEMGKDADVVALSLGSRKSLEDFVKVVLLQPVLKEVELNPDRPLYGLLKRPDFVGAEHSEFLEALKTELLVQMKAVGRKAQL